MTYKRSASQMTRDKPRPDPPLFPKATLSEWILGGVTRRLINPASRCSLLSH